MCPYLSASLWTCSECRQNARTARKVEDSPPTSSGSSDAGEASLEVPSVKPYARAARAVFTLLLLVVAHAVRYRRCSLSSTRTRFEFLLRIVLPAVLGARAYGGCRSP